MRSTPLVVNGSPSCLGITAHEAQLQPDARADVDTTGSP
jgi:hypothetical protein